MKCKQGTLASGVLAAIAAAMLMSTGPVLAQSGTSGAYGSETSMPAEKSTSPAAKPGSEPGSMNQNGPMNQPTMNEPAPAEQTPASLSTSSKNTVPLTRVSNPAQTLNSAKVEDKSGEEIGTVQQVKTSHSGKPTSIYISLKSANGGSARVVKLKASKLRYDSSGNVLMTKLTASEIEAMPAASPMNNP